MSFLKKINARVEPKIMGFSPERLVARFNGKRVVANSIPKGGTHLLSRCLMYFPALTYSGYHYTDGIPNAKAIQKIIKHSSRGCFSAAHLWRSEEASAAFRNADIKQIVMIRDPRDIIVSGVHYILKRKQHHLHHHFSRLKNMDERIIHYIHGVDALDSSKGIALARIDRSFENYSKWACDDHSILIRFEDLVGPEGGGGRDRQIEVVFSIGEHIGIPLSDSQVEKIADNIFSSKSVTFRKGSTGGWEKYFSEDIKSVFRQVAGNLLVQTGYEKGEVW